jgi:hypothetical protein
MILAFESENQGPCGIIMTDVVIEIVPEEPELESVELETVEETEKETVGETEEETVETASEELDGSEVLLDPEDSEEPPVESTSPFAIPESEDEPAAESDESSSSVIPAIVASTANALAGGGSNLELAVENTPENQSQGDKTRNGQKDDSSVQNEPSSKPNSKIIPIAGVCGALFVALVILLCGFLWQKRKKEPINPFKTRYSETIDSRTASFTCTARTARTTNTSSIRTGATSMVSCDEGFFGKIGMYENSLMGSDSMQFSVATSEVSSEV